MSAVIAKEPMGFCTCGLQIEPGERIFPRAAGAIHVGCPERLASAISQTAIPQASGFLFNEMETATIENARRTVGASCIAFDGPSAMQIDAVRLAGQLARVYTLMSDGQFRTLSAIAELVGCLETSASARLRDLRKPRCGGHEVISRLIANSPGTREYKLILRERNESDGQRNAA